MMDLPPAVGFSGHETFPFRYAWFKKGVDATAEDGTVFARDEGMTILGVGKNMVRSIRHWCLAAGLVEEMPLEPGSRSSTLAPSSFGTSLFGDDGWDPYLEHPATLWLLHWQIASNARRATTWYWAFSYIHEPEFTEDGVYSGLAAWVEKGGWKRIAATSLHRDIDCFLRTYVPSRQSKTVVLEDTLDCPLVELGLIAESGERQTYQFNRGSQPDLPDGVLFYSVMDFWDRVAPERQTLSLRDIAYLPGSPGRLFQIDESSLAVRFDRIEIETNKGVTYDDTAGVNQLYRHRRSSPLQLLKRLYGGSPVLAGATHGT
jgi:hypothetical protein